VGSSAVARAATSEPSLESRLTGTRPAKWIPPSELFGSCSTTCSAPPPRYRPQTPLRSCHGTSQHNMLRSRSCRGTPSLPESIATMAGPCGWRATRSPTSRLSDQAPGPSETGHVARGDRLAATCRGVCSPRQGA
jgi:hypothetical protein